MAMRQRLLAIARQLLGNDDDAVDALQDAFVGLWTRADSLSDERHARGATVISVRNASIDLLRRRAVRRGDEAGVIPEPADDTADCYGESHAERLFGEVSQADGCPPERARQRDTASARRLSEWPMEEIAARFGLTEAHVRTIVSRARRTIRDRYLELQRIHTDNHKHNPQTL